MSENEAMKLLTKENICLLLLICVCIAQAASRVCIYKIGAILLLVLVQPGKKHRTAGIVVVLVLFIFLFFRDRPEDRLARKRKEEEKYRVERLPVHFVPETRGEFSSEDEYT
jgi:hypothetical protein